MPSNTLSPQQQLVEYFEACKTSMHDSDDDVMNSNPLENTSTPSKKYQK